MRRTARMGLLLSTVMLGGCAEGLYCESDARCGADEWCDPAARQCLPKACRGQPAGAPLRCEHDILWVCGEAGEAVELRECPYGCDYDAVKCLDCVPYTEQCHGSDLVRCNGDGHVLTRALCDHGCSAEHSMCLVCTPGLSFCDENRQVACDEEGIPGESTLCEHGCHDARRACNECVAGGVSCDGPHRVTCGAEGLVAYSELCVHGCNDQRAQCNECTPGSSQCTGDGDGDALALCGPDGLPGGQESCALGCNPAVAPARCYTFTPTGLAESDLHAGQVDLTVASWATLTVDTDALTVGGAAPGSWRVATQAGGGPELFVVHYRDVTVLEGATVTVQGSRGLALVAAGRMELLGTIDAAARLDLAGPGGRSAHAGALAPFSGDGGPGAVLYDCSSSPSGGGGGAQGAAGGPGGGSVVPFHAGGPGGLAADATVWLPLLGGGMGGIGALGDSTASGPHLGGGGGGVVLLVSALEVVLGCTTATRPVCGAVNVSGGGGTGSGAGGGAGGTVLIEAPTVALGGGLYAVGGGGACGGVPWPGNDGATGGRGCFSTSADSGGNGGNGGLAHNRLWSPTGGGGAGVFCRDPTPVGGGGGGGSAGRIRVRTAPGRLTVLATSVLRGAPCGGTMEACFGEVVGE